MSLPPRQQLVLDRIEKLLQAEDPRLNSMFAAFSRWAQAQPREQPVPTAEAIRGRTRWRVALICALVVSMLAVPILVIRATSNDCPGLSSDQETASAMVRYAACSKSTDAWSKGGR
jgi:hypothetical protein